MVYSCPSDVLVIIPTYNESENIRSIVEATLSVHSRIEVLIVDDNSPDGTGVIADQLAAVEKRIHVLHRPSKEGLGRAYLAGFAWALERRFVYVLEMDADFSHDPKYLPDFLKEMELGADLVLGSRYVAGGGTKNWGWVRRLVSRGGSFYARNILQVPIRDLTGGFKCFRRKVLENLELASVRSTGYIFQIELTYRALCKGYNVREIPIVFEDRRVGKSKMSRKIFVEAVFKIFQIRRWKRK